ncbi:MAG: aspartate--ammonia ligase [Eubacteriales bacterium]|nr:aspartate--ammonia ligase [Eubacteriales bacterium]
MKTRIPENYESKLSLYETQRAIVLLRNTFEKQLISSLNLLRATAPLFVPCNSGINDNLNGVERPVEFDVPAIGQDAQVVHSLAKWKRQALFDYDFWPGKGLYTNMNAIRRDEVLDNTHSIYVDQWDWEAILFPDTRNLDTLKAYVKKIVRAMHQAAAAVRNAYPEIVYEVEEEVYFITTQELEDRYPDLSPTEREDAVTKQYRTVCLMQIGDKLASGRPHDNRAPDYDDWSLNADILLWSDVLGQALEISSMGIRVDAAAMDEQLRKADCDDRRQYAFHQAVLNDVLPPTIGGGIGQSRLCMLLLDKAHIGEVQSSIWDKETMDICKRAGVRLL